MYIYDGYYMVVVVVGCKIAFVVCGRGYVVSGLLCLVYFVFGLVYSTSTTRWVVVGGVLVL